MDTNYCYYSGLPSPLAYLETGSEETELRGELLSVVKSGDEPAADRRNGMTSESIHSGLNLKTTPF